jgi:cytochrome b561
LIKNNKKGYGLVSISLHWIFVITIFSLFGLGFWMIDLDYYSEWYTKAPHIHKSIGMIFFVLLFLRFFWNFLTTKPESLSQGKMKIIVNSIHYFLYLLMLVVFVSGYLISTADGRGIEVFNLFTIPSLGEFIENQETVMGNIHEYSTYTLIVMSLIHGMGALKHHFIDKDNTLKRMIKIIKKLN